MNSLKSTMQIKNILSNFKVTFRLLNKISQEENIIAEEPLKSKLLKVAIIGMPNAGKSTLVNCLVDRKVCPVSSKVHTTQKKSLAIFTEDDTQIVFLDTPGIVTPQEQKKYNLNKSFIKDGITSLHQANLIGVVHDVSNTWTRGRIDIKIVNLLDSHKRKPSFLILNKVDLLKQKKSLLELTRKLTENRLEGRLSSENIELDEDEVDIVRGWPFFSEIFMISALTGSGIEQLRNFLIDQAKPAHWMFLPEKFSAETYEDIILDSVRAKLLDFLPQEIPYVVEPKMELFEIDETGKITTIVIVKCPKLRLAKIIAGESDGRLKQITTHCQEDLQNTFRNYVRIKIILEANDKKK